VEGKRKRKEEEGDGVRNMTTSTRSSPTADVGVAADAAHARWRCD
jgi:hypothetical protein